MKRKIMPVIAMLLLFPYASMAELPEKEAIELVKSITAYRFDSKLPKQRFSEWLEKTVGPQADINWELNDCGEQTGNPASDSGRDFPACVGATAILPDEREVTVSIVVGTFRKGIREPIEFHSASVEGEEKTYSVYRLSDLPGILKKAR